MYLSHALHPGMPAYGGGESFQSAPVKSIGSGDPCNTSRWSMPNHIGTHIDFPRHFDDSGKTFGDYPAGFWTLRKVHIRDMSHQGPGSDINEAALNPSAIPDDTELLIIRTGFGARRGDPIYWQAGPVFMLELADALRRRCPSIRIMGFDAISLSSWADRDLGRAAHRAFLNHPRPILLLEDMNLLSVAPETSFLTVVVSPLGVAEADASPCTVIGEVAA